MMYFVSEAGEDEAPYFEIGKCEVIDRSVDGMAFCKSSRSHFVISIECLHPSVDAAVAFCNTVNPNKLPVIFS